MPDTNEVPKKYRGLKPSIAAEIQQDEVLYFREDKPVPFCGLAIYPVTVRDYDTFCSCSACLTLNRKTSPQGLKMSNLDYLLYQTQSPEEGAAWSYRIHRLFEIVFHIKNGVKCKNKECGELIPFESDSFKNYLNELTQFAQNVKAGKIPEGADAPKFVCPKCGHTEFDEMIKFVKDPQTNKFGLIIDGHPVSSKDFDRFRQIVLFQNFPDYYDDSWINPELKKDFEARLEIKRKQNNVSATLEKKVVCLSIATHYSFSEIFDMTIRKFTMALEAVDDLIEYKITKQALMSGLASLPEGKTIEHWIYKPEKDPYGEVYKDLNSVKQKVSQLG